MLIKKFSLPGWYSRFEKMYEFLEYYYENRYMFYSDRIIDSLYDTYIYLGVPLVWTGGRSPLADNSRIPMFVVKDTFDKFEDIELRHVFTNCLLDNDCLIQDYKCNAFVKKYVNNEKSKVILNHPKLIEHFKINYPNIPIIYSTTMNIKNIDKINEITKNNIYVLNYNYNNNEEYLNQLKHKENIELLCAEPCQLFCQTRIKHYQDISYGILNCGLTDANNEIFRCPNGKEVLTLDEIMKLPHAITNERVEELSKEGFQYFKISGRSQPYTAWLETILYYLALPEYKDYIRQRFLMKWACMMQIEDLHKSNI